MYRLETDDTGPGTPTGGTSSPRTGGSRHSPWREHARIFFCRLLGRAQTHSTPRRALGSARKRLPGTLLVSETLLRRREFSPQPRLSTLATAWLHFYRSYTGDLACGRASHVNNWAGTELLQVLLSREHARISRELREHQPGLATRDVYRYASLITDRLIEKIHREDWCNALMPAGAWQVVRRYPRAALRHSTSAAFAALDFELPLPERFHVHSVLTGNRRSVGTGLSFVDAQATNEYTATDLWYSLAIIPAGRFALANHPPARRRGFDRQGRFIDCAATDLDAARCSSLAGFNALRLELGLDPLDCFDALNHEWACALATLYADIDAVDRTIGLLAEPHLPGAALGITAFLCLRNELQVRRTRSAGFEVPSWLHRISRDRLAASGLRALLLQHYPVLQDALYRVDNPFLRWRSVELIV